MKILLYSDDLEEQDVIDKLFVYLYRIFLSQEKTVHWIRKSQLQIAPSEKACENLDSKLLQNLSFFYCGTKFRSEIVDILSDFWMPDPPPDSKASDVKPGDDDVKEEIVLETGDVVNEDADEVNNDDNVMIQDDEIVDESEQEEDVELDDVGYQENEIIEEINDNDDDTVIHKVEKEEVKIKIVVEEDTFSDEEENSIEKKEILDCLFVDLSEVSEEFIEEMLPVLLEIELEIKKQNPESEIITAFSDTILDGDIVEDFEIIWNVELIELL